MTSITCASSQGYVGCRADDSTKAPLLRATCVATAWGGPARYALRERGEGVDFFSALKAGLARRYQSFFAFSAVLSSVQTCMASGRWSTASWGLPSVTRASGLPQRVPAVLCFDYHVDSYCANETSLVV